MDIYPSDNAINMCYYNFYLEAKENLVLANFTTNVLHCKKKLYCNCNYRVLMSVCVSLCMSSCVCACVHDNSKNYVSVNMKLEHCSI